MKNLSHFLPVTVLCLVCAIATAADSTTAGAPAAAPAAASMPSSQPASGPASQPTSQPTSRGSRGGGRRAPQPEIALPGPIAVGAIQARGGYNFVPLQNELLTVCVCPEGNRIISIDNRKTKTGYLRRMESQLPNSSRAGGIGDGKYTDNWRGGMWEYVQPDAHLGGYTHVTGQNDDSAWITMTKDCLADTWTDPGYPSLKVERTIRLLKGKPTVEIVDRRTNQESCKHAMFYDLMFHLVPFGGGDMGRSQGLPPWSRMVVLFQDGRVQVLSREDYDQQDVILDNVQALLLTDTTTPDEGVFLEFDKPRQLSLWTKTGNNNTGNAYVSLRQPMFLERFEVLERTFKLTPYGLDRQRIDALFAGKLPVPPAALQRDLKAALEQALAATQDPASRGMLKGLERLGQRYLLTGGAVYDKAAAECLAELKHLTAEMKAGRPIHRQFYDDAFLASRKELLAHLPYNRNTDAIKRIQDQLDAKQPYRYAGGLGKLAVECMCFGDTESVKTLAAAYRGCFSNTDMVRLESDGQTIGNANWGIPLVWLNEALARTGAFTDDELAVTCEALWFQARQIDEFGCGAVGNWGTMERTFLGYMALIFPGASKSAVWNEKALECLDKTILGPCSADGGWPEPPGYTHWGMLKGLELMELLSRTGAIKDPASRNAALKRMMDYQWRLMMPDDQLPAIGDGWYTFRADIYNRFARRYQVKEWAAACLRHGWKAEGDDLLFSGGLPEVGDLASKPAQRATDVLKDDGYALFRNAGTQLTMFFGWQTGHGHSDTLSFMLYAHGRLFINEHVASARVWGTAYGTRWDQLWTRATRSHCTVMIDDLDWTVRTPGKCLAWKVDGDKADGAFSAPAYAGVTVKRQVRQDGERFHMTDTIEGGQKLGQYYTWRAYFANDIELAQDGQVVLAKAAQGQVRIDLSNLGKDVEVVIDQAPQANLPPTEEITQRGKILLLRQKTDVAAKATFDVTIEVVRKN